MDERDQALPRRLTIACVRDGVEVRPVHRGDDVASATKASGGSRSPLICRRSEALSSTAPRLYARGRSPLGIATADSMTSKRPATVPTIAGWPRPMQWDNIAPTMLPVKVVDRETTFLRPRDKEERTAERSLVLYRSCSAAYKLKNKGEEEEEDTQASRLLRITLKVFFVQILEGLNLIHTPMCDEKSTPRAM